MSKVSIKNIARAIYESSLGKTDESLSENNKRTIDLISKKNLLNKTDQILSELKNIIDKEEEIIRVKISSKTKIEKKTVYEIENFIREKYKVKNIKLEFDIDESLLGGVKIEIGDEIIDATFRNKLRKLENYLITN